MDRKVWILLCSKLIGQRRVESVLWLLMAIGACLLVYSFSLSAYTDVDAFMDRYMALSVGQSKEFFELRDAMITPKYRIQDSGITLLALGAFMLILRGRKHYIASPKGKSGYILLAIALPFISVSGYVFDLNQGMLRNEFPHWADSLAIPLAATPFQLIILFLWSFLHLLFLTKLNLGSVEIRLKRTLNYWLLLLSVMTFFLMLGSAWYGQYWYALPAALWVYFYLSLAAVRDRTNDIS